MVFVVGGSSSLYHKRSAFCLFFRFAHLEHIKGKNTSIEILLRKSLWHRGIRYRKNYKRLPGTPDIAITKYKIAIFCDSEFFHGHNWEIKKQKLGNKRQYWIKKIERNMARDRENDLKLIAMDWVPIHFWGKRYKSTQMNV